MRKKITSFKDIEGKFIKGLNENSDLIFLVLKVKRNKLTNIVEAVYYLKNDGNLIKRETEHYEYEPWFKEYEII